MKIKLRLYYFLQFLGWGVYSWLVAFSIVSKIGYSNSLIFFIVGIFLSNVLYSHLYRMLIIKANLTNITFPILLATIVTSSLMLGYLFSISTNFFNLFFTNATFVWVDGNTILTGFFLYFIWNILYYAYAYFDKSKSQELKNVLLTVEKNEMELQSLRTQLNPHFMFNSMNSIRALIDENPNKAKLAVTKLSSILRSALINTQEKLIPLYEEMELVKDYLILEKIRYEERLNVNIQFPDNCKNIPVPPLLIQTLVENGIKHGISNLIKGGEICVTIQKKEQLEIYITNSGKYEPTRTKEAGLGIVNTKKRLHMAYGNYAIFKIENIHPNQVQTYLSIPLT